MLGLRIFVQVQTFWPFAPSCNFSQPAYEYLKHQSFGWRRKGKIGPLNHWLNHSISLYHLDQLVHRNCATEKGGNIDNCNKTQQQQAGTHWQLFGGKKYRRKIDNSKKYIKMERKISTNQDLKWETVLEKENLWSLEEKVEEVKEGRYLCEFWITNNIPLMKLCGLLA